MILVRKRKHASIEERGIQINLFNINLVVIDDWGSTLKKYLESPSVKVPPPHQSLSY